MAWMQRLSPGAVAPPPRARCAALIIPRRQAHKTRQQGLFHTRRAVFFSSTLLQVDGGYVASLYATPAHIRSLK